jgi:polyhydroxybutyrate depolymerase
MVRLSVFGALILVLGGCRAKPWTSLPVESIEADSSVVPTRGPGDYHFTVVHDGLTRDLYVQVPSGYQPSHCAPLVLNFHGVTSDAWGQERLSRMGEVSEREGFILVNPEGVTPAQIGLSSFSQARSFNAGDCCGVAETAGVDDVGFIRVALDALSHEFCVDSSRVFSTGMSNGGFFSHHLGCELSERIAAIAPVAGVNGTADCAPTRPIPVMHFHGTNDRYIPYAGQPQPGFISAPQSALDWATRNGCSGKTEITYDHGDTQCLTYLEGCSLGASSTLCTVTDGGHTWPSGMPAPLLLGKTSTDIEASEEIWKFFSAHPRR